MCRNKFKPNRPLQSVCSYGCSIKLAKVQSEKNIKGKNKVLKEKLKTKGDYLKELQTIFNKFIRLRDKDQPCISCGTTSQQIKYDAGHFYSCGAYPNLRFNEDNVHRQCSNFCNVKLSGNFAEYSINLPERIGIERFEKLRDSRKHPLRLSIEEIKELKEVYKNKIKSLA